MAQKKLDNSALALKISLRRAMLERLDIQAPTILETHSGKGEIFLAVYRQIAPFGVSIDNDAPKAFLLCEQRPTWRVYKCDSAIGLSLGVGSDMIFDILDCDPYGSPWLTIEAFFHGRSRIMPDRMGFAVTDGGRQKFRLGGRFPAWESFQEKYGRDLWPIFLQCCQERFDQLLSSIGHTRVWWHGRYGGTNHAGMAYWVAVSQKNDVG